MNDESTLSRPEFRFLAVPGRKHVRGTEKVDGKLRRCSKSEGAQSPRCGEEEDIDIEWIVNLGIFVTDINKAV